MGVLVIGNRFVDNAEFAIDFHNYTRHIDYPMLTGNVIIGSPFTNGAAPGEHSVVKHRLVRLDTARVETPSAQ